MDFKKPERIFVALPVSLEIEENFLKFQKKFKNLDVRWIHPQNLHITLIPPWYESNTEEIIEKLESLRGKFLNFKISFDLIEYGPNKFSPRLIWAKGKATKELLSLVDEISKVLNKEKEKRPFMLHLTLARFDKFKKYNNLPKLDIPIFWEFLAQSFVLMRSYLFKTGAQYEIIKEIKFK
jgi:2'-5' RNA ligase